MALAAVTCLACWGLSSANAAGAQPGPHPDPQLAHATADVLAFARLHMHDIQGDANLSRTLNNTFTFTATQTWTRFHADDTVFVDTGDIQQMWLRDSSNQMRVYLPLAKTSAAVAAVFVGVLKRMARFFVGDPYASAFNPLPRDQMGDPSLYDECPRTLECRNCTCADCAPSCSAYSYQHNWEMDSFCFVVDLAYRFWATTRSAGAMDEAFHAALQRFVAVLETEADHIDKSPYRFRTGHFPDNTPPNATAVVGLLWGDSRPSDDREYFNYNIPENMFAVVTLGRVAELATAIYNDKELATRATALRDSVDAAIQRYGVFRGNGSLPPMYAFEVDGFGAQILMDDANMPNLLGIPYMGYRDALGLYNATREFVLRPMASGGNDTACWKRPELCHGNP